MSQLRVVGHPPTDITVIAAARRCEIAVRVAFDGCGSQVWSSVADLDGIGALGEPSGTFVKAGGALVWAVDTLLWPSAGLWQRRGVLVGSSGALFGRRGAAFGRRGALERRCGTLAQWSVSLWQRCVGLVNGLGALVLPPFA